MTTVLTPSRTRRTAERSPVVLPDSRRMPRKRWTRDDVRRLMEQGFLDSDKRYELIEGEIIEKVGQGRKHIYIINRLFTLLGTLFGFDFVQSQGSLPVNTENEPEPDTAVLAKPLGEYIEVEPGPQDVRLMVEVAASTLSTDRGVKGLIYARAGVAEYWIVNVRARKLEVYRQPTPAGYAVRLSLAEEETVSPEALPDAVIRVADLLP